MEKRKNFDRNSLYVSFGIRLLAAMGTALLLFAFLHITGRVVLDAYFTRSDYVREENGRRLEKFRKFIEKNQIAITDTGRIAEWVKEQSVISIQIYRGETLLYDSEYPEGEEMPEFSFTGNYDDYEAYHQVTFAEGKQGHVFLNGYYSYQFDMYALVIESMAAFVWMFVLVMLKVRNLIRYIGQLDQEIQILESGNLEYPVTIQGNDELASMAKGLDGLRKSLKSQIEESETAVTLNEKLVTEVSHELRTPLTSIMIYVDILKLDKGNDRQLMMDYLKKISWKAEELNDLADRILANSSETERKHRE